MQNLPWQEAATFQPYPPGWARPGGASAEGWTLVERNKVLADGSGGVRAEGATSPSSQVLIHQQPASHHRAPGAELSWGFCRRSLCPAPSHHCADVSFPAATGRVIGRFYGEDGLPTPELTQAEAMMTKGLEADRQELIEKQRFPPCNAEWSFIRGSRFWCSQQR